jgi:predicted DNA-binding protein
MEISKRMIPYSVNLPEETYLELRKHAKNRQASTLVRNAIEMIISKEDPFNAGYTQAMRDVTRVIRTHKLANDLAFAGESVADSMIAAISEISER